MDAAHLIKTLEWSDQMSNVELDWAVKLLYNGVDKWYLMVPVFAADIIKDDNMRKKGSKKVLMVIAGYTG
jgi:hypothetical protein